MRSTKLCLVALFAIACSGGSKEKIVDLATANDDMTAAPPDFETVSDLLSIDYDAGLTSGENVVPLVVDATFNGSLNYSYITITVCAPGTTTCQTIDHVWLDTGSVGLRLPSNTLNAVMLAALPNSQGGGNPLAECYYFGGGMVWGSIRTADLYVSGEKAASLPVQVTGDLAEAVPADCDNGQNSWNAAGDLPGNAILGIAPLATDCAKTCSDADNYYSCSGGGCAIYNVATNQALPNPITMFAGDNNGYVVQMPKISDSVGANSPIGTLTFGIGTRSNNTLTAQNVYQAAIGEYTEVTVSLNGQMYDHAFFDNGTDCYAFDTTDGTTFPDCGGMNEGFYCPPTPLSLTATVTDASSSTGSLPIEIGNATNLFNQLPADGTALDNLAGDVMEAGTFIIGAPVFFGRKIFFGIAGQTVASHPTPFYAL
jgi:Protein of unknown function (DUF3443)